MVNDAKMLLRMSQPEKEALVELATRFQRSQNGTIRLLIRESQAFLREQDIREKETKNTKERPAN